MEVEQTLYVFKVKPSKIGTPFEYLGEVIDEVSVFALSEKLAIKIIKKEFGPDIVSRLVFNSRTTMKLFGKAPHGREIMPRNSTPQGYNY